jgi:AcrR family transcriptional regulator
VAAHCSLTHTTIAKAAVAIADAGGLDKVTIRNLATELDVAAMALYRYVTSKEDILELMADAVQAELSPSKSYVEWRDVMREYAEQIRASMKRHHWIVELSPRARSALTPRRFAALERTLASLDSLNLDIDTMMLIVDTVAGYAAGVTATEITRAQLMKAEGWRTTHDLRAALSPNMTWLLSTGEYPTYERYIRQASDKDRNDLRFQVGLQCVLDGIAAHFRV